MWFNWGEDESFVWKCSVENLGSQSGIAGDPESGIADDCYMIFFG
jgi:hypothetical protein